MIKVRLMHCGKVLVSPNLPFGDGNLLGASGFFTRRNDKIWLPVSTVYIEHPQARILVDTGWHRAMSPNGTLDKRAQIAHMSYLLYLVNQGVVAAGQTVSEQLNNLGVKPTDLDYVILSHLDCDHVSGLGQVNEAKRILTAREELESALGFVNSHTRYTPSMWEGSGLRTFEYEPSNEGPYGRSLDLLGDGSVKLIWTPGHSRGLFATKITGADGRYVLYFSDGGYATRSWKDMVLPGICEDRLRATASLEWIRQQSLDPRCIASWACHDPATFPTVVEL